MFGAIHFIDDTNRLIATTVDTAYLVCQSTTYKV